MTAVRHGVPHLGAAEPSLSVSTGILWGMNSTQDSAAPVAPAPRAIISGYTVHSPPRLATVVDQMCLDGLLEDHTERDADRFTRRRRVSHHHGEYVVALFRQHRPGRLWGRPFWVVEEVNLNEGATRLWTYRSRRIATAVYQALVLPP